MDEDVELPWQGPTCPNCDQELDVEPLADGHTIRIAYTCTTHGLITMADPFD